MNEKIEPLSYSELIAPDSDYYRLQVDRIMKPDSIPIHSAVFNSDFAYTPEFVEEVKKGIPDSIREDISEIERILGIELQLEVSETGIRETSWDYEYKFRDFSHSAHLEEKYVGVSIGHMSITMDNRGSMRAVTKLPKRHHPMPSDKLQK